MKDLHKTNAAKIFKTTEDNVTSEQRRLAKCVAYALEYNISMNKLIELINSK